MSREHKPWDRGGERKAGGEATRAGITRFLGRWTKVALPVMKMGSVRGRDWVFFIHGTNMVKMGIYLLPGRWGFPPSPTVLLIFPSVLAEGSQRT